MASWTVKLLSDPLPNGYTAFLVNTRLPAKRLIFEKGAMSIAEIGRTARIVGSLLIQLVRVRPSVVHLNCSLSPLGVFRDLVCARIARGFGAPVVVQYHGDVSAFPQGQWRGVPFRALQALCRQSVRNIVLNRDSFELVSQIAADVGSKPVLLPNFIEDHAVLDHQTQDSRNNKRCQIAYVGGVAAQKGANEILAIAKEAPELDFVLIGPVVDDMQHAVSRAPDNVTLAGTMAYPAVLTALHSADAFLFPTWTEGFPNAVLEAMAVGLPVVATPVGAIPEMVDAEKGGYLIERGDIGGFVAALRVLSQNRDQRLAMGRFNREKCRQHYTRSQVVRRLTTLYDDIVES